MSFNFRRVGITFLSTVLAVVLARSTALGQVQDGNLVGSILDSTGATVPGARVEVVQGASGI